MTEKTQRRWGILAVAVLMFFVALVNTNINGSGASVYPFVWTMVGYYAYKAKVVEIKMIMKILICINIIFIPVVIIFLGDESENPIVKSVKSDLIFGVLVMLVPKILLFFYCKNQLEKFVDEPGSSQKGQLNTTPYFVTPVDLGSPGAMHTSTAVSKATFIPVPSSYKTPANDGFSRPRGVVYSADVLADVRNQTAPPTNNMVSSSSINTDESIEENYWAEAMAEAESNQRRQGVWAKAFSEADGDLTKAKAAYMKTRVKQMHDMVQAEAAKLVSQHRDEAAKTKAIASSTQQGIEEVMKNFLHSGTISEANLKLIIYQRDISRMIHLRDMVRGNTLLHVCAASGMLDEVRALLASGASPNEPNKQGLLPYHMTKSADIRLVLGRKV